MNTKISLIPHIYNTNTIKVFDITDVLKIIKNGNEQLKQATYEIQQLQDHSEQNKKKYALLPAVMFNGVFSYKNSSSLIEYSCYTALDFDNFSTEEQLQEIGRRLIITPCVYSVFRTPSGRGLKAIILHDNENPKYHGELYNQLLKKFYVANSDSSTRDLGRGNYICYDPNIWINPSPIPYHFEHNDNYAPTSKSETTTTIGNCKDISQIRRYLSFIKITSRKSDESIINILNSKWKKDYSRWKRGNRKNSIFNSASELCLAGVNIDKALNYLTNEYTQTGLEECVIVYQAQRGYINNYLCYGETRKIFDNYGSKRK